jgi:hypothetical protein
MLAVALLSLRLTIPISPVNCPQVVPSMVVSLEGRARMFTYKFKGLREEDAATPYYYGSLPAKPEPGHILTFGESGNRYTVIKIVGKGLEGKNGAADQETLAHADIVRGENVPTLWLSLVDEPKKSIKAISGITVPASRPKSKKTAKEMPVDGKAVDADEFKRRSRENRKTRITKPIR